MQTKQALEPRKGNKAKSVSQGKECKLKETFNIPVKTSHCIRQHRGGRPEAVTTIEGLDEAFLRVIAQHTAK